MPTRRLLFSILLCFTTQALTEEQNTSSLDNWEHANNEIKDTRKEFSPKFFKENKRYLDLTYGSPFYPDCVCGLASLPPARSPRQHDGVSTNPASPDDSRVVGGEEAIPHSLPWMALIILESLGRPICGGSVISDRYVVSAAHCFDDKTVQEDVKVILGEHDRCHADRHTTRFSVDRLLIHPAYRHQDYYADISLLRLSMRLTFSRIIRPICLPAAGSNFEGVWSLVSGWGVLNSSSEVSCELQQAVMPVFTREQCADLSMYPENRLHETLMCAGSPGETDSCQGDSGGPLQFLHPRTNRFTLIGIVSNGVGCGLPDYPGLYTVVSHFIPWILSITRDSAFCFR